MFRWTLNQCNIDYIGTVKGGQYGIRVTTEAWILNFKILQTITTISFQTLTFEFLWFVLGPFDAPRLHGILALQEAFSLVDIDERLRILPKQNSNIALAK